MRLMIFGLILLSSICAIAILGPFVSKQNEYATYLDQKNLPPSRAHFFGTDDLGRDVFTRVCFGARISLFVAMMAAYIDFIIGTLWGAAAGFFGQKIDEVMMRVCDILYSLPYLLVAIVLTVVFGSGLFSIILALSVIGWITMARIVRGQVLQLKQSEFIVAGKALGFSNMRILIFHLLPNAMRPMLTTVVLSMSSAIFAEAFLSFLGLGVQAPAASWGTMAHEGLPALRYFPWRLGFPALFISLTILSLNLIAEAIGEISDVH